MEVQSLDCDVGLSLDGLKESDSISKPCLALLGADALISSSSRTGWRRLKNESPCFRPNIDPLWLNDNGAKMTDVDTELDDEFIYRE